MIVDLPRRWRKVVAAASAAVLLLAALFVVLTHSAERRAEASGPSGPVLLAPPFETAAPPEPTASDADVSTGGVDQVEVCGVGWVPARPDGVYDETTLAGRVPIEQARQQVLDALRADGGELGRASALLLEAQARGRIAPDSLVRTAMASSDPTVYGMAYRRCAGVDAPESACRLLSPERWAQLEPDNANPWIDVLGAAVAHKDRGAQQEALHRIATSSSSRSGLFAAAGAVSQAIPDGEDAITTNALIAEAMRLEGSEPLPPYQAVLASCRGDALKDMNRLQTCTAVADVMANRSDTLLERRTGLALGRQVGWPSERIDRARGEITAFMNGRPATNSADLSCPGIQQRLEAMRETSRIGEAGAMQEWVARSGLSDEELLREAQRPDPAASRPP